MRNLLFIVLIIFGSFFSKAQFIKKGDNVKGHIVFQEIKPVEYNYYQIDINGLKNRLADAPKRFSGEVSRVSLRMPVDFQGHEDVFTMYETQYMEEGLAAKYPNYKTYVGSSKSGRKLYITLTPFESNFVVLQPDKATYLIKPYTDSNTFIGFHIDKQIDEHFDFMCETEGEIFHRDMPSGARFDDRILRKYRYAISTTGEFSQYTWQRLGVSNSASDADKKAAVISALLTAVSRINSVYETDMSMSFTLVNNNDLIVYLDASTDPFNNSTTNMSSLLGANQNTVDANIGQSNYDVSQVWCQGVLQGLAMLGVVCTNSKASGAVRGPQPETDRFIISVASHEMGHQFGATHTFSNSCGGNRTLQTAFESGSGATIMAYAGICPPNLQNWTYDRFYKASIQQFRQNLSTTGTCAQEINLTNQPPVVNAGVDKYIPKQTPFVLTADASDPDGDALTYAWEELDQMDPNEVNPPSPTWQQGPMFRPFEVSNKPYRYFPRLDSILANRLSTTWEVLPAVERILHFAVTVRDNNIEGGQVKYDEIFLGVRNDAGPFEVTSQQTVETWQPGENRTVTWNVAGTDGGNVNCSHVDVILSLDGGQTFTDTLAANVPNNGSATFVVPNINTPQGRIMVKARDNYFFSLSQAQVMIGNYQQQCYTFSSNPSLPIPDNDTNGTADTLHVNDHWFIQDINVGVNITHAYVRDLKVELEGPDGTNVVLWDHNCGGQDNLVLTFDDQGNNLNCNQLTGNLKPVQALSAFSGKYSDGDWILKVSDNQSPDAGTLNSWQLQICYLVGVDKKSFKNVKIYPNPARDLLHIEIPDADAQMRLKLVDLTGRIIFEKNYNHTSGAFIQNIPVSNYQTGYYILSVEGENRIYKTNILINN